MTNNSERADDEVTVDCFAACLKEKLARARARRGGT